MYRIKITTEHRNFDYTLPDTAGRVAMLMQLMEYLDITLTIEELKNFTVSVKHEK
jgi:uncharacterized protein YeeX (DUF496 family)